MVSLFYQLAIKAVWQLTMTYLCRFQLWGKQRGQLIFRFGFIHLKVITLSIPFLQEKVTTAVDQFVRATEMVNSLGLFSANEELAEVPTSELRQVRSGFTQHVIECFHTMSQRPYWCSKTMKWQPCWCSKPILWELNSCLMQTLSFVPTNLHRCWPCE